MKKRSMKFWVGVTMAVAISGMVFSLALAVLSAFDKQAYRDCLRLVAESRTQPKWDPRNETGFYITKAEKLMCDDAKVEVTAAVI